MKTDYIKKDKKIKQKTIMSILSILAFGVVFLFLFTNLNSRNYAYNLSKRVPKIIAICFTGTGIAISTIMFQTITNNRILTPGILGLDSVYVFIQTLCAYVFGIDSIILNNSILNFCICVFLMIFSSFALYKFIFSKNKNLFTLLLTGTICGTLFRSMSSFMQVLIDPNDFISLQGKLFASFNKVNVNILSAVIIIFIGIFIILYKELKYLDVFNLGRHIAINLGVDYDRKVKKYLVIISILVSAATALVGPVTFLGILVSNISYEMFKTYKHSTLMLGSTLISIITLVSGQYLVERVFNFSSSVSIIINFIGGTYFIYLLIREVKK